MSRNWGATFSAFSSRVSTSIPSRTGVVHAATHRLVSLGDLAHGRADGHEHNPCQCRDGYPFDSQCEHDLL